VTDARPVVTAPAAAAHTPPDRPTCRFGTAVALLALLAGCAGTTGASLPAAPETKAERALAQRGDDWLTVGKRLLTAREYGLAMKAFERSLRTDGPSAEAMTGAGIAAESQGLLTMAARYFERARDLAPESVVVHNNLGVVLFRLDEVYRARQAFQTAFALSDGRNELALRNLRLTEAIINEAEATRNYLDPAVNFRVERLGSSEFRLIEWEPPGRAAEPGDEGTEPAANEASGEQEAAPDA
jgi:Tfp pilus assembly protein PilF